MTFFETECPFGNICAEIASEESFEKFSLEKLVEVIGRLTVEIVPEKHGEWLLCMKFNPNCIFTEAGKFWELARAIKASDFINNINLPPDNLE